MRTFLLAALLLTGCRGGDDSYSWDRGEYDPDRIPGIEQYDQAAAEGDPQARFLVATWRRYMTGDYAAAVAEYGELAEAGHLQAIHQLAWAYMTGRGISVDYDLAAYWLGKAAELGDERSAQWLAAYREYQGRTAPDTTKSAA